MSYLNFNTVTCYRIILREVQSYIGKCILLLVVESDKNENANSRNISQTGDGTF